MVKISMEPFVKLFQPDRYPNWMLGKDLVPIDHTHPTPSTTPELQIWLQRRRKTKHADKWYCIRMWIVGYWSEIFDNMFDKSYVPLPAVPDIFTSNWGASVGINLFPFLQQHTHSYALQAPQNHRGARCLGWQVTTRLQ